jgi:hypothetical protein
LQAIAAGVLYNFHKEVFMQSQATLDIVYTISEDVVARVIEGEVIIVPLTAGIGDTDDELFTLNETGKAIWDRLDGFQTVGQIVDQLIEEFDAPSGDIERDVIGMIGELARRKMIVAVSVA